MRTFLKSCVVAIVPTMFAALSASSAHAASIPAPIRNYSSVERVACNGTWGPHCGPGLHWVCRNGSCGCAACLGTGTGPGVYGYGGWYHRGWYRHFWRRGWYHRGWHRHFWRHRGWHHHGWHHHFWHHHGHHGGHHRSDMRLKQDIVPLARLGNGLELYRFRYKGADHTAYVGVMAQEVQKIDPGAVSRDSDGYLTVDYDRLGLEFMTWDEWLRTRSADHPIGPASTN